LQNIKTNNKKILSIGVHIVAWACFFTVPYLVFFPRLRESISDHMLVLIICNNLFLVAFYYLNTLVLIPKLLVKRKWVLYAISIAASLLFFLYVPRQIASLVAEPEVFNPNNREFIRNPTFQGKPRFPGNRRRPIADPYNTALFLLVFTFGTAISAIQRWLKTEQNRKETEHEKLNTELSFLKSQVNPHFFFKLSSIMRYILTETQRDMVPLNNEVDFIHNFIDLQQVRLTDKVQVHFSAEGNTTTLLVAPLLFIPFVENAFKYGVSTKESSSIDITLRTEGNKILFSAVNYIVPSENNLMENTGIGINNVKRRLELMYPDRHKLTTTEKDNYDTDHLEIDT
jgi:two-component system LytT family sensor kinase